MKATVEEGLVAQTTDGDFAASGQRIEVTVITYECGRCRRQFEFFGPPGAMY